MEQIKPKWLKVIIWLASYADSFVFALVGGFFFLKSNDEELKKTCKKAFVVHLIFIAATAFLFLYNALFLNLFNLVQSSFCTQLYSVLGALIKITQVGVYCFIIIRTIIKPEYQDTIIIK